MDIKTQCVVSLVVLVYVINMSRVAAHSCPEELKLDCKPEEELVCKGGVTWDACGFCMYVMCPSVSIVLSQSRACFFMLPMLFRGPLKLSTVLHKNTFFLFIL